MKTDKPKMPRKDASFHVAAAGAQAMRKAEKRGAPPEAVDALMSANEPLSIGGLTLRPLCLPVVWALESVGSAYVSPEGGESAAPRKIDTRDVALAIACFADPQGMHRRARCGDQVEIEMHAMELCSGLGVDQMASINAWIDAQFAQVRAIAGSSDEDEGAELPKKPAPLKGGSQ